MSCLGQNHSEIADEGHSSTQAPQSTHLDASITATSSQVMALWGQTSTHAPHATHSDSLTVTIWIPLEAARLSNLYNVEGKMLGIKPDLNHL